MVVSAKAHDVPTTVATYRLLSQRMPEVPLHIGVTEAGTLFQGLIKSASGLGILLEQGRLIAQGDVEDVVSVYEAKMSENE